MFRKTVLCLLFLTPITGLFADIKISKDLKFGTNFYFKTDKVRAFDENYAIGADFKLEYDVLENWELRLEIDAGTDSIHIEDLAARVKLGHWNSKFGLFSTNLLMDDVVPFRDADSIILSNDELTIWDGIRRKLSESSSTAMPTTTGPTYSGPTGTFNFRTETCKSTLAGCGNSTAKILISVYPVHIILTLCTGFGMKQIRLILKTTIFSLTLCSVTILIITCSFTRLN